MTRPEVHHWRGALLLYAWSVAGLGGAALVTAESVVRRLPAMGNRGDLTHSTAFAGAAGLLPTVILTVVVLGRSGGARALLSARDALAVPLAAAVPLAPVLALARCDTLRSFLPPTFSLMLGNAARALPLVHLAILWSPLAALWWVRPKRLAGS